ncbi:MAG: hypothetical protein P8101_17025 [Candidatus Thiodiazotropha sp.]|jgi:hypothetical protein
MYSFVFRSPDGTEITEYDEGFFRDIFLNKGKEFWSIQAGDAGIHITDEEHKAEVVIIYSEGNGFFIQHLYDGEEDEYVISHGDDLKIKTTVYPGGEPWEVPISFFCERQEALDVITEILKSGSRNELRKWVNLWDGDWAV